MASPVTVGVALLLVARFGSTGASPVVAPTTIPVVMPTGWVPHTLGELALAVPRSWAVKHTVCPNAPAPATLLLGVAPVLIRCPAFEYPATVVTVSQLSPQGAAITVPAGQRPMIVNGITVYTDGSGSPTALDWTVPSLDVRITGLGAGAIDVLATIHRA